jgi:CheY-like chemotaxis protein
MQAPFLFPRTPADHDVARDLRRTLSFLFPRWATCHNSGERDVRTLETEVAMHSNSILLVQSHAGSREHLRTRLEGKGYRVVEAADAAAAMDIINASDIGLVVTDLYVRSGKSRCLARAIAKSPALRRTKLLAYTDHGRKQDRDWARRIGADGYVITRSGEDRFLSVVDHLMEGSSTPRRTSRRTRRVPRVDGDTSTRN